MGELIAVGLPNDGCGRSHRDDYLQAGVASGKDQSRVYWNVECGSSLETKGYR